MNKSYIIGNTNVNALKLNEAETIKNNNQYYLEGVFADLSGKENRNGRIYTPEEYLPHLNYLREDIKKGDALLGELDHPEDRFEVNIKEVSHEIVDIWYVPEKKQVMGKIRLLDTPNGKIAKSLIDDGVPLHISSRSAGSVDPTSHKVDIQQIFTFDLVAKPGFAEAILHRVNESVSTKKLSNDSVTYLNNNIHNSALNVAPQFGIMNENVSIINYSQNIKLREEALKGKINTKININEMAKHILNEDEAQPLESSDNAADAMGIPTADISLDGGGDTSDNGNDNNTTEEKTDDLILGIEAVYNEESEDGENLILSIEASYGDEETPEEEDSEESEESEDETSDEETPEDETNESGEDKPDPEKDALNDKLAEAKEKLNNTYTVLGKVDAFMGGIKRKNEAMEATIEKYPFSAALSESNYTKFDNLNWEQKEKVAKYINENCIMDTNSINALWENALISKPAEPVWLSRANEEYRSLYENASEEEKNNLKYAADFMIFESQMDIDTFWKNSGLKSKEERRILNESFINSVPKVNIVKESNELPYSSEFINNIGKELERMNFK